MNRFTQLFYKPRALFLLGLTVCFLVTLLDVMKGRDYNFQIFMYSTIDFWHGVNPYTPEWVDQHGRFFLYSPVFSVLFTPFAFLPAWLGPFAWNLFNYVMFFAAIFLLPDKYTLRQKCHTFLILLLILAQSMFAYQYNVVIAYLFLFAYGLMEREKGSWAVLLILISGYTKIYGIFQLALLLCYPKFWKNMGYVVLWSVLLMALPLLNLPFSGLIPYYETWFECLATHQSDMIYDSLFYALPIRDFALPNFRIFQIVSLLALVVLFLSNYKKYASFAFRAQALGILMGWIILFSDSAEKHTYIIALLGYLLWYYNYNVGRTDRILLGANFFLLCVVPIDILFPVAGRHFICYTLWLNVWVFFLTWLRMAYTTFKYPFRLGDK